jgi:peptide/nickel transport system substrate-binding protein
VEDRRFARLLRHARRGSMSRRALLQAGLRLGLATPAISALLAAAPSAPAAAAPTRRSGFVARQEDGGGTFTVLISSGVADIDPHYTYSTVGSMVTLAAYEMLIRLRGESTEEFEPMLAESWEASPDQATYTFRLVPNVTFHDGTPCDAEAVKASFTRFLEQGAGPVNVISRFVESADQIEAVDTSTVRFNLGRPQPLFLPAMASQYGPMVVSPTAVEENRTEEDPFAHEFFLANAVGTGPYRLESNSLSEGLVFSRFEEYHRGWEGNHFDQVVLRVVPENATRRQLLEIGEADALTFDLTPEDVEALQTNPDLQVLTYETTRVDWIIMNAVKLDVQARQGFSYAFPYPEVIDGAYRDLVTRSGPIANSIRGHDPDVFLYQTDLQRARELILAAGFQEGDTFEYMVSSDNEVDSTVAQLFQANLAEIGFTLEIAAVEGSTIEETVFGNSPAEERPHFIGGWEWWPDYNDPWNQLAPNFLEEAFGEGGSNGGAWVNPRFEEIMAEAETYTDENRLVELMEEAQNILTEQDPPCIFIGQARYYTILRNDIRGFVANPLYLEAYPFYAMSRGGIA